jgi:hypothetical protein
VREDGGRNSAGERLKKVARRGSRPSERITAPRCWPISTVARDPRVITGATLIASFGDDTTALLLYSTHTLPVPSVLSAKYFVVDNGQITAMKGLFDKSVFAEAQAASEHA